MYFNVIILFYTGFSSIIPLHADDIITSFFLRSELNPNWNILVSAVHDLRWRSFRVLFCVIIFLVFSRFCRTNCCVDVCDIICQVQHYLEEILVIWSGGRRSKGGRREPTPLSVRWQCRWQWQRFLRRIHVRPQRSEKVYLFDTIIMSMSQIIGIWAHEDTSLPLFNCFVPGRCNMVQIDGPQARLTSATVSNTSLG